MELQGWSSVEEVSDPATPVTMPEDLLRSQQFEEKEKQERIKAMDEATREQAKKLKDTEEERRQEQEIRRRIKEDRDRKYKSQEEIAFKDAPVDRDFQGIEARPYVYEGKQYMLMWDGGDEKWILVDEASGTFFRYWQNGQWMAEGQLPIQQGLDLEEGDSESYFVGNKKFLLMNEGNDEEEGERGLVILDPETGEVVGVPDGKNGILFDSSEFQERYE